MMSLPKDQLAAVRQGDGEKATLIVKRIPMPQAPGPGQILVKISWAGICGSDRFLIYDRWQMKMQESTKGVPGHEAAGRVAAVHPDMQDIWKIGDRVGIKWVSSVCGHCEFCRNGTDELQCASQHNPGFNAPGTFQEYLLTDGHYATRIPVSVPDDEAAVLMCGGLTAYTACKRSAVRSGEWIVVLGAGGGLGHLAVQYGKAMGMQVIGIAKGSEKEKLCERLGVERFIDRAKTGDLVSEVIKITSYGAHGVVVAAPRKEAFRVAPLFLRPGGTVVSVALPQGTDAFSGTWPGLNNSRRLNIAGSVTGTRKVGKLSDQLMWVIILIHGI
ncbi:hypothetical protein G647_10153 [Cladophialophora carrionii CBS 160.54]|uniref:Enoyl reductase (ER) domain-containing protein n=1 Tax=Cladophialophora carrionii CBS 160.54 TaxID=1279043 RepID=V9DJH9_9EURO|nr:uncharacterized protein G647_10153 [Cladophialophora carrionii CBS 160.54]ETI27054.1 hypothetical protein G647_10153 [Cladophialophora carrionii CBS 160.54]